MLPLLLPGFDCKSIITEMGLTRGIKRPVEILYRRLSSPVNYGHASASIARKGVLFTMLLEKNVAGIPKYSKPINGIHFTRSYSSEVSSSEQVNLIKQLRDRTSAPFKEVKSSLVACNWDIGEYKNVLLICSYVCMIL